MSGSLEPRRCRFGPFSTVMDFMVLAYSAIS